MRDIFGSKVVPAAAFYNSTLEEHSFCERGFTRAFAAEQGYVFDFLCFVEFHAISIDVSY